MPTPTESEEDKYIYQDCTCVNCMHGPGHVIMMQTRSMDESVIYIRHRGRYMRMEHVSASNFICDWITPEGEYVGIMGSHYKK